MKNTGYLGEKWELQGSQDSGKRGKVREIIWSSGKTWKNQGINLEVRESLENSGHQFGVQGKPGKIREFLKKHLGDFLNLRHPFKIYDV